MSDKGFLVLAPPRRTSPTTTTEKLVKDMNAAELLALSKNNNYRKDHPRFEGTEQEKAREDAAWRVKRVTAMIEHAKTFSGFRWSNAANDSNGKALENERESEAKKYLNAVLMLSGRKAGTNMTTWYANVGQEIYIDREGEAYGKAARAFINGIYLSDISRYQLDDEKD